MTESSPVMLADPDPVSQTQDYLDTKHQHFIPTTAPPISYSTIFLLSLKSGTHCSLVLCLPAICRCAANNMSRLAKQKSGPFELLMRRKKELKKPLCLFWSQWSCCALLLISLFHSAQPFFFSSSEKRYQKGGELCVRVVKYDNKEQKAELCLG